MEGSLGVGEYMQLNVEFKPKKVGDYKSTLTVHYNTGKETVIILCSCIVSVLVIIFIQWQRLSFVMFLI